MQGGWSAAQSRGQWRVSRVLRRFGIRSLVHIEGNMNRIVHLALKVEDLERTTEFYQKVFGFVEMNTEKVRDHTSRHLSDGVLDVALIKYDSGSQSAESKAAAEGPCINPFRIDCDDLPAAAT